jgi:hypothetical protein
MVCFALVARATRSSLAERPIEQAPSDVLRISLDGKRCETDARQIRVIPNNVLYTFGGLYEQQQIAFRGLTVISRAFRHIRRQGLRCYFGVAVGFVAVSTGAAVGEAAACAADDGEVAGAAVGEEPGEG